MDTITILSDEDDETVNHTQARKRTKRKLTGVYYDQAKDQPNLIIIKDEDGTDENFPISDEKYAEELQLQEALIFSSPSLNGHNISSSSKQPILMTSYAESKSSESSNIDYIFCAICMDSKTSSEMFRNSRVCSHLFCADCIREHVATKVKENVTKVKCPEPDCQGVIGPEVCRTINVPNEVLERWENTLCESVIMESHKFYCPFRDCSAMLVDDGGVAVTASECPNCHRLFCAQCKVAWHCGMNCVEYQSMKKGEKTPDDVLLLNLAKRKKWMKCPNCKFWVAKVAGCLHISCRCGHNFCYRCGKSYNIRTSHATCA